MHYIVILGQLLILGELDNWSDDVLDVPIVQVVVDCLQDKEVVHGSISNCLLNLVELEL